MAPPFCHHKAASTNRNMPLDATAGTKCESKVKCKTFYSLLQVKLIIHLNEIWWNHLGIDELLVDFPRKNL